MHKHIIFWAMVALAGFGCQTTSTTHHDHVETGTDIAEALLKDTTPIDGSSVTLVVHGMGCPLCSNNLGQMLMKCLAWRASRSTSIPARSWSPPRPNQAHPQRSGRHGGLGVAACA